MKPSIEDKIAAFLLVALGLGISIAMSKAILVLFLGICE